MDRARILIVDDEEHIRETMQMALEAAAYQTDGAAEGGEALEKFGAGSDWDLVLLDQRMPGMEGMEVLRRMRERDPAARVIMATAYGSFPARTCTTVPRMARSSTEGAASCTR